MNHHPFWRRVPLAARTLAILFAFSTSLSAQRVTSLDGTVDFVSGVAENPQRVGDSSRVGSIGFFPSISLTSRSSRSSTAINYAFGWDRLTADPPSDTTSHNSTLTFTREINPTTNVSLSNSLALTSDPQAFFALRGVIPLDDGSGFLLLVDPVVQHQNFLTESINGTVTRRLSGKSSLSLTGGFYLRDTLSNGSSTFSNQRGGNGQVSFARRISERSEWNVGYTFAYYSFDDYNSTITNSAHFGFSSMIAKDTVVSWGLGASHARSAGTSNFTAGYEGSAGVSRRIKGNTFSVRASQDGGHPNGLGSVSRNRVLSLGVDRKLSSVVNLFLSASAFDSRGVLDNHLNSRGTSAAGNLGFAITRTLSVQVGAQYQRYSEPAPIAFTQKRLFASLRYSHPNLLRSR